MKLDGLDQNIVQEFLRYDPDTGKLFWRERAVKWFNSGNMSSESNCKGWNKRYSGKEAFTALHKGYKQGAIFNKNRMAHQIIWLYMTGEKSVCIDHLNGVRHDNRWINLSNDSFAANRKNVAKKSNNTTGYTGIYFRKKGSLYIASIHVDGKLVHLGSSKDIEIVKALREEAEIKYGYSERHGK